MPKIPPDKIPELVERYNNGESYRELAEEFNVSHMTVKRAIASYEPPPEPPPESLPESPDMFHGFKLYDKVRLKKDIIFRFHDLTKGEEAQIIGFNKPENGALVTVYRYHGSLDVPIDALQKM